MTHKWTKYLFSYLHICLLVWYFICVCVCSAHRHAHARTRKSEAILWRSALSFYLIGSMEIKLGSSALKTSSFILRAILAAPDALVSDLCFRHFFMHTFTHTTTPPSPPSQLPFSTTISRMFRPLSMSPMFSHFSKDPPGLLSSPQVAYCVSFSILLVL